MLLTCLLFIIGDADADEILKIILGNPNMFGGVLACILDNTVPGKYCLLITQSMYICNMHNTGPGKDLI